MHHAVRTTLEAEDFLGFNQTHESSEGDVVQTDGGDVFKSTGGAAHGAEVIPGAATEKSLLALVGAGGIGDVSLRVVGGVVLHPLVEVPEHVAELPGVGLKLPDPTRAGAVSGEGLLRIKRLPAATAVADTAVSAIPSDAVEHGHIVFSEHFHGAAYAVVVVPARQAYSHWDSVGRA